MVENVSSVNLIMSGVEILDNLKMSLFYDWVLQIDRDKTDIGLKNMSDEEIRQISKQKFKSFVKKKINEM